jgi:RsiW-degrading membrane proteinase PrsW (M82 family)
VGGILGLIVAGVLEFETLRNAGLFQILGISFIEEAVKLIFPIGMYITWKYRHEADGLLFGVAAGMGFAALETMGYGLTSLIQSNGQIGAMQQILVDRGLLSPAGHAAWTGLVCAALWRKREHTHRFLNFSVIGTFLLAVVLHTLWNVTSLTSTNTPAQLTWVTLGFLTVGGFSLSLLISRFRAVRKHALADGSNQQ